MNQPRPQPSRPNPPAPDTEPGRGSLLFSILSAIVGLLFVIYGGSVITSGETSPWLAVFGYVTAGYGVLTLVILACAHTYRATWCVTMSQAGAAGYLLVYVFALSAGLSTGLGIFGILPISLALWCNWYAATQIIRQLDDSRD